MMMKAYRIQSGAGTGALFLNDVSRRALGPFDVRIQMHAVSINSRDISFAGGNFRNSPAHAITPLVDGCGEVIEIGPEVTRFTVGDRVVTNYYLQWIDGAITPCKTAVSFGVQTDGTLAEELVASEEAFVHAPHSLDDRAAATLSCAGLTAWNALFCAAHLKPGAKILLLGTGGVSIWGLQLAHAAGLHPILTSSQDRKLERASALGAISTLNYRKASQWQDEVLHMTQGTGVDLVVEVGGEGTLARSLQSCCVGGTVVVIGRVSGGGCCRRLKTDPLRGHVPLQN